jgi:hypothetical protein
VPVLVNANWNVTGGAAEATDAKTAATAADAPTTPSSSLNLLTIPPFFAADGREEKRRVPGRDVNAGVTALPSSPRTGASLLPE